MRDPNDRNRENESLAERLLDLISNAVKFTCSGGITV